MHSVRRNKLALPSVCLCRDITDKTLAVFIITEDQPCDIVQREVPTNYNCHKYGRVNMGNNSSFYSFEYRDLPTGRMNVYSIMLMMLILVIYLWIREGGKRAPEETMFFLFIVLNRESRDSRTVFHELRNDPFIPISISLLNDCVSVQSCARSEKMTLRSCGYGWLEGETDYIKKQLPGQSQYIKSLLPDQKPNYKHRNTIHRHNTNCKCPVLVADPMNI